MTFEPVNKKNIKVLCVLAREIWTEHYTPIIGEAQVKYMLEKFQSEEAISNQIKNEGILYYLLKVKDKYVGYMSFQFRETELFLSKLYVLSTERGRGYGKKAMEFIEKAAIERNLDKIILTVNKNNRLAISAYKKMGFENKGSVFKNIGGGFVMDDYIMQKNAGT